MFKTGQFVEWKSEDEAGVFTHVGKVIDYSAAFAHIEISPSGSTITISHDDGTLREIPEPKSWSLAKPKVEQETVQPIKKPTTKTVRQSTGTSKKDLAVAIYKEMMDNGSHPARKDVIARFMSELDMTNAGASTYQNTCKKELS